MEIQKDLFGKVVKEKVRKPTRLEKSLLDYDKASFDDRLKRLNYIKKNISRWFAFARRHGICIYFW